MKLFLHYMFEQYETVISTLDIILVALNLFQSLQEDPGIQSICLSEQPVSRVLSMYIIFVSVVRSRFFIILNRIKHVGQFEFFLTNFRSIFLKLIS